MRILNNQSVLNQIKSIKSNNNQLFTKFLIDDIKGEILNTICTNCSKEIFNI